MTQTSTPARTATPVLWWVPLTPHGFGNTEDCYVLAETAADAKAATVMAGMTMHPGAWVAAGIPRRPQHVPAGRCVAVFTEAPAGAKVWSFGPGAARRMREAAAAKRLKRMGDVIDFWKMTD